MPVRRRTILIVASIVAAAGMAIALLGAALANPDRYRPKIVSFLERKTGHRVEIGHIGLRWLSGSIQLFDLGIRNPAPFPAGYVFKAPRIDAVVKIAPLLRQQIVIQSITLHDPVIDIISDPDGVWNFEKPASEGSNNPIAIGNLGTIPVVTIVGGQLFGSSLIDPSDRPGPIVFEAHDLSASLANVDLHGFAAPQSSPVATGSLKARSLRLGAIEVTAIRAKLRLLTKQVVFESVNVDADHGHATGELRFDLAGKNARFQANARLSDIDVAELLSKFPGARGKMTGRMDGQMELAGPIEHTLAPLAGIRGNGHLTVLDGDLPELNSNDSLRKMVRFRDPKDAGRNISAFSSFSGDLDLTKEQMTNREIKVEFYGIDLECSGNLELNGSQSLDYHGAAKVLKKQSFVTNVFAEIFHEARKTNGKLVFPLQITGTLANPKFTLVD